MIIVTKELLQEKNDIVCSNFCEAFRLKEGWDAFYVFSYLQFIYNQGVFFNFEGKTSGLKNLQMEQAFKTIEIPEQKSDISVLSSIDKKIAFDRKANIELEALAKQIYDYWFVQFDFPNEEGKPYKSSGGKMVWNETLKREIPDNWELKPLSKVIELEDYRRIPLSNKERAIRKGPFPYYGATGIMDYVDDYIFDGEYILLAEDGSTSDENGNPVIQYIWGKNWVNNHAHIISIKNKTHLEYYYYLLKTIPAVLIETGSIQKKISQENLLKHSVICPPNTLIESFCQTGYHIRKKQVRISEEIHNLKNLRDYLLPLLMNGQITIKD